MDKVITTALLIVISMVLALVLFNAAYPAINQGGDAINNMASRQEDRMKSEISIIHAAGELDSTGQWQDTNGDGQFNVFVWVKNTGATTISALNTADLFFGREGNFVRIPYGSNPNGFPFWTASLASGSDWTPTNTLQITLHYGSPLQTGRYYVKVTTPNGIVDQYFLGM